MLRNDHHDTHEISHMTNILNKETINRDKETNITTSLLITLFRDFLPILALSLPPLVKLTMTVQKQQELGTLNVTQRAKPLQ